MRLALANSLNAQRAPVYDPAAEALFAAMTTAPTAARKALINATIGRLKAAGIWDKLDLLYFLAAETDQAGRLNWKAPSTFALTSAVNPTFTADRGFTGNGSTQNLITGWSAAVNGVNFTQNSASVWTWCLSNSQEGANSIGRSTTPGGFITLRNTSDQLVIRLNDGSSSTLAGMTDCRGLIGASRVNSATVRGWKNGVQFGSDISVASTGLVSGGHWALGANSGQFTSRQHAAAAWGDSLAGLESAFYSAVLAYMQAVGAA